MPTVRVVNPADIAAVASLWTAANVARHAEAGLPLGPVAGADVVGAQEQVRRRLAEPIRHYVRDMTARS